MAGGYKQFGPTYNATKFVRVAHEGMLNGNHNISASLVEGDDKTEDLAGRIAAIGADGVELSDGGAKAVGLITEDLGDMVNASLKATFYFRGGEYYVAAERTGISDLSTIAPGDELTTDGEGKLVKLDGQTDAKAVGVVTKVGAYPMGNMYEHATGGNETVTDLKDFIGFILYV